MGSKAPPTRMGDLLAEQGFEVASVGMPNATISKPRPSSSVPSPSTGLRTLVDILGFGRVSTGSLTDGIDAIVIVGLDADRSSGPVSFFPSGAGYRRE